MKFKKGDKVVRINANNSILEKDKIVTVKSCIKKDWRTEELTLYEFPGIVFDSGQFKLADLKDYIKENLKEKE